MSAIWNFILTVTGVNGGAWLNFWGGFGSSLSEFGIFIVIWKKFECHAPRCHRIGLHRTADGTYMLCHKHHPDVPDHLKLEDIHAAHFAAKRTSSTPSDTTDL